MRQLVHDFEGMFVLHVDGKHKLHHGKWILITLGTHMLKCVGTHKFKLGTTFVPLIYLMCLQHESSGECANILKYTQNILRI